MEENNSGRGALGSFSDDRNVVDGALFVGDRVMYKESQESFDASILSIDSSMVGSKSLYSIKILHSQNVLHGVPRRQLRRVEIVLPPVKLEPEENVPTNPYQPPFANVKIESSDESPAMVKTEPGYGSGLNSTTATEGSGVETSSIRRTGEFSVSQNIETPAESPRENAESKNYANRRTHLGGELDEEQFAETIASGPSCAGGTPGTESDGSVVIAKTEPCNDVSPEAISNGENARAVADRDEQMVTENPAEITVSDDDRERTLQLDKRGFEEVVVGEGEDEDELKGRYALETSNRCCSSTEESNRRGIMVKMESSTDADAVANLNDGDKTDEEGNQASTNAGPEAQSDEEDNRITVKTESSADWGPRSNLIGDKRASEDIGTEKVATDSENEEQLKSLPAVGEAEDKQVDEGEVTDKHTPETSCLKGFPVSGITVKMESSTSVDRMEDAAMARDNREEPITEPENEEEGTPQLEDREVEEGEVEEGKNGGMSTCFVDTRASLPIQRPRRSGGGSIVLCDANLKSQAQSSSRPLLDERKRFAPPNETEEVVTLPKKRIRVANGWRNNGATTGLVTTTEQGLVAGARLSAGRGWGRSPIDAASETTENAKQSTQGVYQFVLPSWAIKIHEFKDSLRNRVASKFPKGCAVSHGVRNVEAHHTWRRRAEVLDLELRIEGKDEMGQRQRQVESILLESFLRQKLKRPAMYMLALGKRKFAYVPLNPNPDIIYTYVTPKQSHKSLVYRYMVVLEWAQKPPRALVAWVASQKENSSRNVIEIIEKGKFKNPQTTCTIIYIECADIEKAEQLKAGVQERLTRAQFHDAGKKRVKRWRPRNY